MSSLVDKIKERIDAVDVIGAYVKLEKSGSNYKAKCPFHNERTPSFYVSPGRGSYYCFGCGAKGDIFSFVQEFEGLDFMGALKILATKAGVEISSENIKVNSDKDRLLHVLEAATLFYQSVLGTHPEAEAYLKKRGVTPKTIKEWRIGFARDAWEDLHNHLLSKGFTVNELSRAGLVKKSEKPNSRSSHYDAFRGRVMFPIMDTSGRVIGFSGRILNNADSAAKYINSPETVLFNKSEVLYGLDKAKLEIRKKDYSILVEGQMDLISVHQGGYLNTVASSGTALTRNHLERLKRLSNRIIMAFDSDNAGFAAAKKNAELALSMGMEVKITELPDGSDPADILLTNPEIWKDALKNSDHLIDFYLRKLSEKDARKLAREVRIKVLPFVNMLESSIEKSHFVKTIAKKTGVAEEAVWDDLKRTPSAGEKPYDVPDEKKEPKPAVSRLDSIERRIMGIIGWQDALKEKHIDTDSIRHRIIEIVGEGRFKTMEEIYLASKDEIAFETEAYYDKKGNVSEDVEELFLHFEEDYLKTEFAKAMSELSKAEVASDQEASLKLLGKCHDLSKKIASIGIKKSGKT